MGTLEHLYTGQMEYQLTLGLAGLGATRAANTGISKALRRSLLRFTRSWRCLSYSLSPSDVPMAGITLARFLGA